MRLFLASEAKHPETLKELNEFVGGLTAKKIAYIPTAANGEEKFGEWKKKNKERPRSWEIVNTLGARITPIQLEDFRDKSVVDKIKGNHIIWFAGGMPGYLMYWIRRCEIDKYIREILEDGTIFVGSSAGAMIASPTLDIVEGTYIGEVEHGASCIPGLGLVDFDIYPHYEDDLYDEIKKRYKGKKMYLLKNGEEIFVQNDKVTVVGEERII